MSLDAETAQLYERIVSLPENAAFLSAAREFEQCASIHADIIGVVPGAFHREHRDSGADGARIFDIARKVGCEAELIPVASFGRLDENAAAIVDWLAAHRGKRVALISLSKGGADVKRALALRPESFSNVAAWVSLSGIVNGTPLIAWLRNRPLRWWAVRLLLWWRGHSGKTLEDLRYDAGGAWPAVPPTLHIVHVVGFPLERDLAHPWAPRAYQRLAPLGPNDGGGILLADCEKLPGTVRPILGADHYLMPSWDILSLLTGIVATALAPHQASQCANHPVNAPATRSIT